MPNVDDGCKNLNESIQLFKKAASSGITDIILTPHYILNTKYHLNNQGKAQITNILKSALEREGIKINIYFGNEAYIDRSLPELISSQKVSTLANSRYLLLELPVELEAFFTPNLIFDLKSQGITPIIAHPERYRFFQDNPQKVNKYLELGCLLQGNYMSLLGKYGKPAQKTLKILLKLQKISFLASDIHHSTSNYHLPEVTKKLKQLLKDNNTIEDLLINNARKIIANQSLKS